MPFFGRLGGLLVVLVVAILASACASTGTVGGGMPRPRPFPGAPLPPTEAGGASGTEADSPAPPASPALPAAVLTALDLRGTPYRNGGSDPTGFDCSGFVQWVYNQHGVRMPREVRDQYREGKKIDRDEVQPGDLLFFETVSRGASHVGVAIGGNRFVHAPSSTGVVRVESYTGSYWAPRFVGARRITTGNTKTN